MDRTRLVDQAHEGKDDRKDERKDDRKDPTKSDVSSKDDYMRQKQQLKQYAKGILALATGSGAGGGVAAAASETAQRVKDMYKAYLRSEKVLDYLTT